MAIVGKLFDGLDFIKVNVYGLLFFLDLYVVGFYGFDVLASLVQLVVKNFLNLNELSIVTDRYLLEILTVLF